jgi:hypothetical protein
LVNEGHYYDVKCVRRHMHADSRKLNKKH